MSKARGRGLRITIPGVDLILKVDVYSLEVGICHTRGRIKPLLKAVGTSSDGLASARGMAWWASHKGKNYFLVYLPRKASMGTVCHEMLHTAWHILECVGVVVTCDSQEPLAHLQGHLVESYLDAMAVYGAINETS